MALEKGVDDDIVRDAAGTMYNAGTDTVSDPINSSPSSSFPSAAPLESLLWDGFLIVTQTMVTIENFALAVLDNPLLQSRAQSELDEVLGPLRTPDGSLGRLPEFADEARPLLPPPQQQQQGAANRESRSCAPGPPMQAN